MTGVYGTGGSGKNIFIMATLKRFPEHPKFFNFPVKLPKSTLIDSLQLFELEDLDEINDLTWDEAYTELDQRDSFSDQNRVNSYLLFQARKHKRSVISISQLNILDIRWRKLELYTVLCRDRPIFDKYGNDFKGDFYYRVIRYNRFSDITLPYGQAKKYFDLYDTEKTILPRGFEEMITRLKLRDPVKKNTLVNAYVDVFIKNKELPNLKKKITHDWVKDKMLEYGMDLTLEVYVYTRLRTKIV